MGLIPVSSGRSHMQAIDSLRAIATHKLLLLGCPVRLNFFNHSTVIDWTINPDMKLFYSSLLHFRDGSDALKQGQLTSYSSDDVCAFTKSYNNNTVFILVNLRSTPEQYIVPAPLVNSEWKNAFDGTAFSVGTQVTLQPYEFRILK